MADVITVCVELLNRFGATNSISIPDHEGLPLTYRIDLEKREGEPYAALTTVHFDVVRELDSDHTVAFVDVEALADVRDTQPRFPYKDPRDHAYEWTSSSRRGDRWTFTANHDLRCTMASFRVTRRQQRSDFSAPS